MIFSFGWRNVAHFFSKKKGTVYFRTGGEQMESKKFWKEYDEMKDAVEHIENAVSGSEIVCDLEFIAKKVKKLLELKS